MRPDRTRPQSTESDDDLRPLEGLALVVWSVVSFHVSAWVIGEKLLLASIYGWSRVRREHLAILHMPKHSPWPVSNGDFIDPSRTGLHTFITIACTTVSVIAFALFLQALRLHRALRQSKRRGMSGAETLRWYESCWTRALKLCLEWSDKRIGAWVAEVEARTDVNWILHENPMWHVATLLLPTQMRGADRLNLRRRLQAALESDPSLLEVGAAQNAQAALDQTDAVLREYGSSLAAERARLSV